MLSEMKEKPEIECFFSPTVVHLPIVSDEDFDRISALFIQDGHGDSNADARPGSCPSLVFRPRFKAQFTACRYLLWFGGIPSKQDST